MEVLSMFFNESPKITRCMSILCVGISLLTWLEICSPLSLYYNYDLIFKKYQFWRLITNFFYFGNFSLSLIFHLILFCHNSKYLEKQIFHNNSADYLYFIMSSIFFLSVIAPYVNVMFLSNALNYVMTYYWGRKSKHLLVNFMGLFIMRAPYLPFFYLGLSYILDSDLKADILGITVGHLIFYLKDIYPRLKRSNGYKFLDTPYVIKYLSSVLGLNNEDIIEINAENNDIVF